LPLRQPSNRFWSSDEESGKDRIPEFGRYWLVDPLCGTSNFAAGIPLYATNIALVEDNQVTIGVVADGVTGEIYVAQRGEGAWLLEQRPQRLMVDANALPVNVDPGLPGPGKLGPFSTEFALRVIAEGRLDVRILSTTLPLAYLARGRLGAAVFACAAPPVHVAAGLLVAHEAGARVTNEVGEPWNVFGPIHIAAANATIHDELRRIAARVVAMLTTD
jgi:myo-inositol-1(or 4)-monophosphatase